MDSMPAIIEGRRSGRILRKFPSEYSLSDDSGVVIPQKMSRLPYRKATIENPERLGMITIGYGNTPWADVLTSEQNHFNVVGNPSRLLRDYEPPISLLIDGRLSTNSGFGEDSIKMPLMTFDVKEKSTSVSRLKMPSYLLGPAIHADEQQHVSPHLRVIKTVGREKPQLIDTKTEIGFKRPVVVVKRVSPFFTRLPVNEYPLEITRIGTTPITLETVRSTSDGWSRDSLEL